MSSVRTLREERFDRDPGELAVWSALRTAIRTGRWPARLGDRARQAMVRRPGAAEGAVDRFLDLARNASRLRSLIDGVITPSGDGTTDEEIDGILDLEDEFTGAFARAEEEFTELWNAGSGGVCELRSHGISCRATRPQDGIYSST